VLVHCNSYLDGYWTDVTRTFVIGTQGKEQARIGQAVMVARARAISEIRPGSPAWKVDHAARQELKARGYGEDFKHPAGHGVGFHAISPTALPRLHPKSPDVLEKGMVFNLEPAVYIEGYGGMRHCDVIAVTESGAEVLTPFQSRLEELEVPERAPARSA
jgi:Xaa-Pro aminopeptidase